MKIKWEVEDGYVGKSRPQYLTIDDKEIEDCETEEEKQALIEEYVKDDFDQMISYSWEILD